MLKLNFLMEFTAQTKSSAKKKKKKRFIILFPDKYNTYDIKI